MPRYAESQKQAEKIPLQPTTKVVNHLSLLWFIELQQAVQCCRKIREVERAFWSLVYCGTLALTGERISSMVVYLRNAVPTAKEMYMKMMSKK